MINSTDGLTQGVEDEHVTVLLQSPRHRAISVMALIKVRLIIPLAHRRGHVMLPGDGAHCHHKKGVHVR